MPNLLSLTYPEPLQPVDTWQVFDSTKVLCFMRCPRKYFFEYVLGWRSENPSIHLEFGSAWHLALEFMLQNLDETNSYSDEVVAEAYSRFLDYYRGYFPASSDAETAPKNPSNAFKALVQYQELYKREPWKVLYTEIAGASLISEDRTIHFKMDTILESEERGIFSMDHKTAGRDGKQTRSQFDNAFQLGTYTHALYMLYPPEQVYGAEINLAILRKGGNAFVRIPQVRTLETMEAWLWMANYWVAQLEMNYTWLSECSTDDTILQAFPKCSAGCGNYGGCSHAALCTAWSNPLTRAEKPPVGMCVSHWDPRENEEQAQWVLSSEGIEKGGRKEKNPTPVEVEEVDIFQL